MDWTALISVHGIAVVAGLTTYVVASHTMRQRRQPAAAIAWVITLALVPYVGIPLYLIFGTRKLVRPKRAATHSAAELNAQSDGAWPQRLAAAMSLAPAASFHDLHIHEDGREALESLHRIIDSATRTLDICTYILGRDAVAGEICERLERRAREGVKVRMLIDSIGNLAHGRRDFRSLRDAGIEVVNFVPPLHSPRRGRFNLRDHRKMAIADGDWLWCGGRNLAAEYFEGAPGVDPWQDLTFELKGTLAALAHECFANDWAFATNMPAKRAATREPDPSARGQLFPTGPDQTDDTVYSLLVTACFRARTRIVAVTPYFVPDPTLLMALTLAARRGVHVDLVLPAKSNHMMADHVRHRALRDLAEAGARIRLVPVMIHAKAVVVDDTLALAGSANLDERSLFINFELMVAFYEHRDVKAFADWIERRAQGARIYVAHPPGLWRDLSEGLVLWLAFQL
jgi:cardiolipin synthase